MIASPDRAFLCEQLAPTKILHLACEHSRFLHAAHLNSLPSDSSTTRRSRRHGSLVHLTLVSLSPFSCGSVASASALRFLAFFLAFLSSLSLLPSATLPTAASSASSCRFFLRAFLRAFFSALRSSVLVLATATSSFDMVGTGCSACCCPYLPTPVRVMGGHHTETKHEVVGRVVERSLALDQLCKIARRVTPSQMWYSRRHRY